MKKLFTLFLLSFGSLIFAQDLDFAQKLNRIDSAELRSVSNEIIGSLRGEFMAAAFIEGNERNFVVYYYPSTISKDSIKADLNEMGTNCELCHKLIFSYYYEGANVNLEIKGVKKYAFRRIEGKYLDLFPWWQKHFAPDVTAEDLLNKKSDKRYINNYNNLNISFVEDQGTWVIRNVH